MYHVFLNILDEYGWLERNYWTIANSEDAAITKVYIAEMSEKGTLLKNIKLVKVERE